MRTNLWAWSLTCKKPASKLSVALWRQGGKRKENLQLRLWSLNICIEKVDAKCSLAKMTLVMTSLPLARVFQCLFTFALVSASRLLAEIWQLSRREATGKLKVDSNFRDVVASSPSFSRPAAGAPHRACSQTRKTWRLVTKQCHLLASPTYLTSSRSVTQKASTLFRPLSWKTRLASVMIFFYGYGTLSHRPTPNLEGQALQ